MTFKKRLLKNFFIQNFLALIASGYIYLVRYTSIINVKNSEEAASFWRKNEPFILAFWHSQLMMITFSWKSKKKLNILASGHSDGRFGSLIAKYLKSNNIPTSNSNKKKSLRPIFELLKNKDYIAITPDGPRGPKEKVSEGIIKIARKTNSTIIPIGFWSSKNYSLKSWDSFLITLPFSKCSFVWGDPIKIPNEIKDNEIEKYQKILEKKITLCVDKAKNNYK